MYIARGIPGREFRVAVDPVLRILLLDRQGLGLVGELPVALHDPERSGDAARGAQRKNRRGGHPRIVIGVNALLGDRAGTRGMSLQVPVGFVVGLPDAAEVGLALDAGGARGRRLARGLRHGHGNNGADSGRSNGDRCHRA
jgi:hypothetical protein